MKFSIRDFFIVQWWCRQYLLFFFCPFNGVSLHLAKSFRWFKTLKTFGKNCFGCIPTDVQREYLSDWEVVIHWINFSKNLLIVQKEPPAVFYKKVGLTNFTKFTGKHLCQNLFFSKVADLSLATLFKKEALAQVVSWEFCEIFQNSFFTEHPRETASDNFREPLEMESFL